VSGGAVEVTLAFVKRELSRLLAAFPSTYTTKSKACVLGKCFVPYDFFLLFGN